MGIEIEIIGPIANIPVPERPPNDDVRDPSRYIPQGMTTVQRKNLRAAAREFTNSIGGSLTMRTALSLTKYGEAAENMYHYRHRGGQDKVLNPSEIESILEVDVPAAVSFHDNNLPVFLKLIRENYEGKTDPMGYLSANSDRGGNWFGQYADNGEWFYAMGGFAIAYGALARLSTSGRQIVVSHRSYIYDRYNWDLDKKVDFPATKLGYILNDTKMNNISELKGPTGQNYFDALDANGDGEIDTYSVMDPLMGSLQVTDGAKPFDIWGAGTVETTIFEVPLDARGGMGA